MHWDWDKIKADYITDSTSSYRKLAKKYDVPYSTLNKVARKHHWFEEKSQYRAKMVADICDKTFEEGVNRTLRLLQVSDTLLKALETAANTLVVEDDDGNVLIDAKSIKQLSSALKDIRDVQVLDDNSDQAECGVVLLPPVKEHNNE